VKKYTEEEMKVNPVYKPISIRKKFEVRKYRCPVCGEYVEYKKYSVLIKEIPWVGKTAEWQARTHTLNKIWFHPLCIKELWKIVDNQITNKIAEMI